MISGNRAAVPGTSDGNRRAIDNKRIVRIATKADKRCGPGPSCKGIVLLAANYEIEAATSGDYIGAIQPIDEVYIARASNVYRIRTRCSDPNFDGLETRRYRYSRRRYKGYWLK